MTESRDRLIVALDRATAEEARALVERIGDEVNFYKIGLELLFGGGISLARDLKSEGKRVFLDMKLLDISNTVERATTSIARLGVDFLTVHGHDRKTLEAAVRGRGTSQLKLLAVTVLTHLDRRDIEEQGVLESPAQLAVRRAKLAAAAGADGVITSGEEAAAVRAAVPASFLIVTPGIRPLGGVSGDQARIVTPSAAIHSGADYLVVGRPITGAAEPRAAASAINREIVEARATLRG
jgi:orotidine-5'-phosphate decarboxylase